MRRTLCLGWLLFATSCWIGRDRPRDAGEVCTTDIAGSSSCTPALAPQCPFTRTLQDLQGAATFGSALSMSSSGILVGDSAGSSGLNANGRAQIFPANGSGPTLLVPVSNSPGDQFGISVAMVNDVAWVGSEPGQGGRVTRYINLMLMGTNSRTIPSGLGSGSDFGKYIAYDGANLLATVSNAVFFVSPDSTAMLASTPINNVGPIAVADPWAVVAGARELILLKKAGTVWSQVGTLALPAGYSTASSSPSQVAMSATDALVALEMTGGTSQRVFQYALSGSSWGPASPILDVSGPVTSLALSGDLAVVGMIGRAWVLQRRGGQWLSAQLGPGGVVARDLGTSAFGTAVAVSGAVVAVGAPDAAGAAVHVYTCSSN